MSIHKEFLCKNNERVIIYIDEVDYTAKAKSIKGEELGEINFKYIESDKGDFLLLSWAYINKNLKFKRQCIGREIIKSMSEITGLAICVREHDGITQDDGSHLTGDAPSFVAAMKAEGLLFTF